MVMLTTVFENYKACALDCINFKLVRTQEDAEAESTSDYFHPEFAHQLYGEDENIFGYKDLSINLFYLAGSLKMYLEIKYSDKLSEKQAEMKIDEPLEPIKEIIPQSCCFNKNEFIQLLEGESKFRPFGNLVNSYDRKGRKFEVYKCDQSAPGFLDYHKRLQTFIMFFIDGASFIEDDDENWLFYVTYEKYSADGQTRYATIGYSTVYLFFAYPDLKRARLSQFLILSPFTRMGHGSKLLTTIYSDLQSMKIIKDITVEDPSEDFTTMRDIVDTKIMAGIWTKKLVADKPFALPKELLKLAQENTKLNRKQLKRIYEIVKLLHLECNKKPKLFTDFQDSLKGRIKKEFEKPVTKLSRHLLVEDESQSEHDKAAAAIELEHQATQVNDTYNATFNHYSRVVDKVQGL